MANQTGPLTAFHVRRVSILIVLVCFPASQLARRAKQTEQMEFLYQNGAEGSGKFPTSTSMSFKNSSSRANSDAAKGLNLVKIRGTLLKTGPNQKGTTNFPSLTDVMFTSFRIYFPKTKTNAFNVVS